MACAPACFPDPDTGCFALLTLDGEHGGDFATPAPTSSSVDSDLLKQKIRDTHSNMIREPTLSSRGQKHRDMVTPFWSVFDLIMGNAYCPEKNPNGIINMGIANNYLMEPELLDFFHQKLKLMPYDLTYGTSLFGSLRLFDALCLHYNSSAFSPVARVLPEHIITGPGCGPLLDQVFEHLADPGDSVLIAAPYYNGFDADLSVRSGVKCVPVYSTHAGDDGTAEVNFTGKGALRGFEEALAQQHGRAKSVIVCNPHNPVGRCYNRSALLEYGKFAEKHDLHLVFDEIYALSTYVVKDEEERQEQPRQAFLSALSIDWAVEAGCHPARVHILSSASKDFGMNGFRIGTLVSQSNSHLIRAMKATAKLYMVSAPADTLFSALLSDQCFYRSFITTNQARISQAYRVITRWCRYHCIKYTPSNVGHFLLMDLERFMPTSIGDRQLTPKEREGALWANALNNLVAITPGSTYYHPHNGTFRVTFTLRRPALLEGLSRLEKILGLSHWSAQIDDIGLEIPFEITDLSAQDVAVTDTNESMLPPSSQKDMSETMAKLFDAVTGTEALRGQPCAC